VKKMSGRELGMDNKKEEFFKTVTSYLKKECTWIKYEGY
jgi:hypothetical protein